MCYIHISVSHLTDLTSSEEVIKIDLKNLCRNILLKLKSDVEIVFREGNTTFTVFFFHYCCLQEKKKVGLQFRDMSFLEITKNRVYKIFQLWHISHAQTTIFYSCNYMIAHKVIWLPNSTPLSNIQ